MLVPWLLYMSIRLPDVPRAHNWSLMWTGIDVAEAIGLIVTGVMVWRRSARRAVPAAITCAVLVLDAWVDITTSAAGAATTLAIAMAVVVEIPVAVLCLVVAISSFPRRSVVHEAKRPLRSRSRTSAVHF